MASINNSKTTERILARFKGLQDHLQPAEAPLSFMPGIWDNGQATHSMPCDIILTNQRIMGYAFTKFPRERLFLDALTLSGITVASFRQKSHEPLFRELLLREGQRKVYIRAPRKKLETLYTDLRAAIGEATGHVDIETQASTSPTAPIYGRQEIHTAFERSSLAMILLFTGGIVLEILGILLWATTGSTQAGLPLFFAGLVAVVTAFFIRRKR